jgi:methyl-accepting chemotaxis protein
MQKKSKDMEGVQARQEPDRTRPRAQTDTEWPAGSNGPIRPMASRGAKSLMKTSELATKGAAPRLTAAGPQPSAAPGPARHGTPRLGKTKLGKSSLGKSRAPTISAGRQQKIEERIAAATEELASGITEAASAAEELRRAMEQIATGAEEAASASQQTLAVATNTAAALLQARQRAESARGRSEKLQSLLSETASQIGSWASNIKHNGERQAGSVAIIEQLNEQAASIGDVAKAVSHVSDETNLLALNAAIEAARAGDHGRGFAVVADEVRALAETSEKSAREAQSLAGRIQEQVGSVAAMIKAAADGAAAEAEKGQTAMLALGELRKDVGALIEGNQSIAVTAVEAEAAAREAQKGAEIISSAAEEQAAAAAEALRSVEQQTAALDESQTTTQSLASLTSDLGASRSGDGRLDQVASAAEQLSAAVQEISGAAAQIMVAVDQISRGGQQQAAATQEASAAMVQIEKTARATRESAANSLDRCKRIGVMLGEIRLTINDLSAGVARSMETTRGSLRLIAELEEIRRNVDKIVDGIGMVSIQTNMLAVNGSIEAARAGDSGKGFAVVSKDIRNLARDSGENAGRVKDTVRAIRDQIATVRRELEQTMSSAETENQKTASVLSSLDIVEKDMSELATSNQQILAGAETILSSTKEAAQGAQQVAAVAEEAGSAAAQAAAAAKQQARGAESLAAAVEEIASLAEDIQRRNG